MQRPSSRQRTYARGQRTRTGALELPMHTAVRLLRLIVAVALRMNFRYHHNGEFGMVDERMLSRLALGLAICAGLVAHQSSPAQKVPSVSKPGVSPAIQPQSTDAAASSAAPAPAWTEGQPVQVMRDLKTSPSPPKKPCRKKTTRHFAPAASSPAAAVSAAGR